MWEHDHHCSHSEDVAITCIEDEDEDPNDQVEVVPSLTNPRGGVYALRVGARVEDICGEVRVELPNGNKGEAIPRITGEISTRITSSDKLVEIILF